MFLLVILITYSCEKSEYDFLFIHNHPPRLDITNNYADGILRVDGYEEYLNPVSGNIKRPSIFVRYADTIKYMDQKSLPVEPGLFKVFLTDTNSFILVDTFYIKVRFRDKHTEIMLEP